MLEHCLGTINEMPKKMMGIARFPPTSTNLPAGTRINRPCAGQSGTSSSSKGAKNDAKEGRKKKKKKKSNRPYLERQLQRPSIGLVIRVLYGGRPVVSKFPLAKLL